MRVCKISELVVYHIYEDQLTNFKSLSYFHAGDDRVVGCGFQNIYLITDVFAIRLSTSTILYQSQR